GPASEAGSAMARPPWPRATRSRRGIGARAPPDAYPPPRNRPRTARGPCGSNVAARFRGCVRYLPLQSAADFRPSAPPGEAHGFLGGTDQRPCLIDRLLVLGLGIAVGDDAAPSLDDHHAVLDHRGAQRDAIVHAAIAGEIADRARIDITPLG